jgi:homocysteine S-methyltransferase
MVNKLNHGVDIGNNPIGRPTAFSIGVGVNPGAVNLEEEIRRFEWKVEAGAEYAITQPVFDTEQLKSFLDKITHVKIPIVAGIWPLVSFRNAEFLHNEVPGVQVTPEILDRMRIASDKSKEHAREEGIAIARESLLEVRDVIQGVQVSAPFGNVKYALQGFRRARRAPISRSSCAPACLIPAAFDKNSATEPAWIMPRIFYLFHVSGQTK